MVANGYARSVKSYRDNSVLSMSPGELVVALFDECIKDISFAKEHIKNKNYQERFNCLSKAIKIMEYMTASLDMKIPISEELAQLYEYYIWAFNQVNVTNSIEHIDDLIIMITDVRDGFKGAAAKVAAGQG
ncbi:MAG: flagellar export chaperone FliS [Oscillospiraceae bacterium]|jgi:flagellar protein FliS|nr:flagellar export chaperone FliS [Oscillospiraceae bacterium]